LRGGQLVDPASAMALGMLRAGQFEVMGGARNLVREWSYNNAKIDT
jgi:hypothetical protein